MKKILLTTSLLLIAIISSNAQNLTDSLLMHFPFSGNANDISGNNYHGTEMGNVSLTTDRFGNVASAYKFDGIDDYINIPHDNGYKKSLPLTFSAWISLVDSSLPSQIINIDNSPTLYAGANMNVISGVASASFTNALGGGSSNYRETVHSSQTLENDKWYHLVISMYAPDSMDVYVNGVLDVTSTYSGVGNTLAYSNTDAAIGFTYNTSVGADHYYLGKIDDVMFWNRGLTSSDVSELYNKESESAICSVIPTTKDICTDESQDIILTNTQDGIDYTLYDASDSSIVDGPYNGGSSITFNTGNLTTATNYTIFGSNDVLHSTSGNALHIIGVNPQLTFGSFTLSNPEFTAEMWVNDSTTTQNFSRLLIVGSYQIVVHADGGLHLFNGSTWVYSAGFAINKGEWNHIAFTVDNGAYTMYLNGNVALTGVGTNFSTASPAIGYGGSAWSSAGVVIDEIKFWDEVKTQSQIIDGMRKSTDLFNPGTLIGYYQFEEGMGNLSANTIDTANTIVFSNIDTLNSWQVGLHNNDCDVTVSITVDCLGGINGADNQILSVYPNPANQEVFINVDEHFEKANFKIYNMLGVLINTQNITSNLTIIDLIDFEKGVYFIEISIDGHLVTKKFIKAEF